MAVSSSSANIRVINPMTKTQRRKTTRCNSHSALQMRKLIERHWELMPERAKTFLLESPDSIDLRRLTKFWSSPLLVEYTSGEITAGVCGASWCLALSYLKMGMVKEACALTLNGSFLRQCSELPIETIVEMCKGKIDAPVEDFDLPLYLLGYQSVGSPQTMELYLQQRLPSEYQHMMESLVKTSSVSVMKYVDQIGDDWSGKSKRSQQKHSPEIATETQMQLILVEDTNKVEKHEFNIGSCTTLKTLFNDYADKRDVSLRSLRFSYGGSTLFLSSVGNKTPDQLKMRDQDVISVHDANVSQEASKGNSKKRSTQASSKKKTTKQSTKKMKGKGRKKKQTIKEEPTKTLEEYKAQHSGMLSKLHAEAYNRLKEIRMQLNALELERQPPKKKRRNKQKKNPNNAQVENHSFPDSRIGGKAGKPSFLVHVGEVQNLYKTTKSSQRSSCATLTLDLHGCSTEEAVARLDGSLEAWVDTAMRGSYPFVIPAKIVCGCGNQVLSETVEKWIREHVQVANAMKNWVS